MFGRHLLRSFRSAWGGRGFGNNRNGSHERVRQPGFLRRGVAAAALGGAAGAGQLVLNLARNPWGSRLVAGVVSGSAATAAWHWRDENEAVAFETAEIPWVQDIAAQPGMREMLVPGQMLRKHPVGQLLTEDDHLFETMRKSDQVREFRCFYHPEDRKFYSVVMLGKDVCGYPSTVHGGLTAAIVDETFGGLYTALLTTGNLGATLPGLTARLELDYKKKIPSGTVLLVTAELESVETRKVWMKATVSDGSRSTFATGRALFVAPNIGRQLASMFNWKQGSSRQPVAA